MRTCARGTLLPGIVALLASAAAAACVNATETTEVFASQHRFVAIVRDDVPLTMLDLVTRERRELLPAGRCGRFPDLSWSPDGSRLLCTGQTGELEATALVIDPGWGAVLNEIRRGAPAMWWWCGKRLMATAYSAVDGSVRIEIRDDRGRVARSLEGVDLGPPQMGRPPEGNPWCAPAGDRIVYRDAATSQVRVVRLDDFAETLVARDAWPMTWTARGDSLIIARGFRWPEEHLLPEYEVSLLDIASGRERRLPLLDDGTQFWLSPDGENAVFIPRERRPDGLPSLAIMDLHSGAWRPIPESLIAYGSEYIPWSFVRFSADGHTLYWISDATATFAFDLTREDAQVESLLEWKQPVAFAPDARFVTHQAVEDSALVLYLARGDGAGRREIARAASSPAAIPLFSVAWRPAAR